MPDRPPAVRPLTRSDGLTVIRHADPVPSARALAQQLGGTVAVGGGAVRTAVDHRLRASHLALAADPTPIDLDRLGDAMRRAEAVLARTRARVSSGLARSLNTSLAIHPDTIRQAADELLAAERALHRAQQGDPPGPARGRIAATSLGALGAIVGFTLAFDGDRAGAGIAIAGSFALAALVALALLRRVHRREVPTRQNDVELARRRWQSVAGPDDDPEELDRVLRRYDPQRETVNLLAAHHPAVRAAERAVADRRRAWVRGWRLAVGDLPGSTEPAVTPRRALVLVDLYRGLDATEAHRLHADLGRLGRDAGVIVVIGDVEVDLRDRRLVDLTTGGDELAPGRPGVAWQPA
ncbi:MAG: hypothetical protein KF906_09220 [Actinobacteria bacterium]|nr:hypothetical protein [Actinomycetota bacterium]